MLIFRAWATCGLRRVCLFVFLRAGEAKHRGIIGRGQSLRLREPHNASRDTHNKMEMHTLSPPKSRMKPGELGQNAPFFYPWYPSSHGWLRVEGGGGGLRKGKLKVHPSPTSPFPSPFNCSEQSLSKSKSLQEERARSRCVQGELLDSVRTQEI